MTERTRALSGVVLIFGLAIISACGGEAVPDAGPVGRSLTRRSPRLVQRTSARSLRRARPRGRRVGLVRGVEAGDGVLAIYEPKQWQEVISYLVLGADRALALRHGHGHRSDLRRGGPAHGSPGDRRELPLAPRPRRRECGVFVGGRHGHRFTRARATGLANPRVRGEVAPDALCGPLPKGVTEDNYVQSVMDGHRGRHRRTHHRPWWPSPRDSAHPGPHPRCHRAARRRGRVPLDGRPPSTRGRSGCSLPRRTWTRTRRPSLGWPGWFQNSHACSRRTTPRLPTRFG